MKICNKILILILIQLPVLTKQETDDLIPDVK